MNRQDLIREIYTMAFPKDIKETVINLNINRGEFVIKKLWNIEEGLIVIISNQFGEHPASYVDYLRTIDLIFIYRKLLKIDIFHNMKESYPDKTKEELIELTESIFNKLTKRKRKVVHVN